MSSQDDNPTAADASTYDVIEMPKAPSLPGTVVLRATADDALDVAAAEVFVHALTCVRTFGDFHMAVSAAPVNEPFFRRLMLDPALREFPWAKTHLWLLDELHVRSDDPRRRGITLLDYLAEPSDIPRAQVHLVDLEVPDPAAHYEKQMGEHLGWREKGHDRLDYTLLDMSDASVEGELHHAFPADSPTLSKTGALVASAVSQNSPRITMTLRAINASRFVAGIITGEKRQSVVRDLVSDRHAYSQIRPLGGELRWYVDHAASTRKST